MRARNAERRRRNPGWLFESLRRRHVHGRLARFREQHFFHELSKIDSANDYYTTNNHPEPTPTECATLKCTPAMTDPVLKLVRVDYPLPAQDQGDQYSIYYAYNNDYQTSLSP